MDKLPPYSR